MTSGSSFSLLCSPNISADDTLFVTAAQQHDWELPLHALLCPLHVCRLTYLTNDPSQVLSHSWSAAEQDPAWHWALTPCCVACPSLRAAGPWEAVAGAGRLVFGLKRHECVHLPAVSPTHSLSFSWPRKASRARFPSLWSCALCPPDDQPASQKAGRV